MRDVDGTVVTAVAVAAVAVTVAAVIDEAVTVVAVTVVDVVVFTQLLHMTGQLARAEIPLCPLPSQSTFKKTLPHSAAPSGLPPQGPVPVRSVDVVLDATVAVVLVPVAVTLVRVMEVTVTVKDVCVFVVVVPVVVEVALTVCVSVVVDTVVVELTVPVVVVEVCVAVVDVAVADVAVVRHSSPSCFTKNLTFEDVALWLPPSRACCMHRCQRCT